MSDADALDHGYAGLARSKIGGSISPLSSSDHSHRRHGNSLRHAKAHPDAEYETTRIPHAHRPSGHSCWRCLRSSGSGRIAKSAPIGHRHAGSRRSDDRRRYARCGTMPDMTRLVVDGPVLCSGRHYQRPGKGGTGQHRFQHVLTSLVVVLPVSTSSGRD
jgi:hypothetical protein